MYNLAQPYVEYVPGSGPNAQTQTVRDIEDLKRSMPKAPSPHKITPNASNYDFMDRSLNDRATFLRTQGLDISMNQRMKSTL